MFFLMTTATGAALWAVDLERKRQLANPQASRRDDGYRDELTV